VHPYWQQPSYTIDYLTQLSEQGLDVMDQCLLPVNSALSDLHELTIDAAAVDLLKNGVAVKVNNTGHSDLLSLVTESGEFIGIGKSLPNGFIAPKRLMNTAR